MPHFYGALIHQIHFPAELFQDCALVYFQMLQPGMGYLPLAVRFRLTARPVFGYEMKSVQKYMGNASLIQW